MKDEADEMSGTGSCASGSIFVREHIFWGEIASVGLHVSPTTLMTFSHSLFYLESHEFTSTDATMRGIISPILVPSSATSTMTSSPAGKSSSSSSSAHQSSLSPVMSDLLESRVMTRGTALSLLRAATTDLYSAPAYTNSSSSSSQAPAGRPLASSTSSAYFSTASLPPAMVVAHSRITNLPASTNPADTVGLQSPLQYRERGVQAQLVSTESVMGIIYDAWGGMCRAWIKHLRYLFRSVHSRNETLRRKEWT